VGKSGIMRDYYYQAEVICEYEIRGIASSLSSTPTYKLPIEKEFYGLSIGKSRAQEWLLESYPKGKSIMIYYNPQNPQEVVLKSRGISWLRTFGYSGFAGVMLLLGLTMFTAFFISKQPRRH